MAGPKFKGNQLNVPLDSLNLTNAVISGSFSGSYIGDGSGLSGVGAAPAAGTVSGSDQLSGSFVQKSGDTMTGTLDMHMLDQFPIYCFSIVL